MMLSTTHVSRRMSTLHKMVDAVASGVEGVKWNHVIHYLKAHCKVRDDDDGASCNSSDEGNSNSTRNRNNTSRRNNSKTKRRASDVVLVENPLPDYYIATDELKQEMWIDQSKGDSVLRACLSSAPPKVIAALSFLLPEALLAPDTHSRVVLHYACRYPVSERLDAVIKVLISASPSSLLHRDDDGRTPLHYLFWYHASNRSPEIVSLFCQNLVSVKSEFYKLRQPIIQKLPRTITGSPSSKNPNRNQQKLLLKDKQQLFPLPEIPKPGKHTKIPYTAAVVPDSAHGCLPLHYAVMEGASLAAIQILFQVYPQSKHFVDRYGRTPLHWYLGAGTLDFWNPEDPSLHHVSGEEVQMDLQLQQMKRPAHDRFINLEMVQMLLSSRVARTADYQQRYPLHWATCFLAHNYILSTRPGWAMSLQIVQFLLDNFVGQLICCDYNNMTPAMLLFDTVGKIQFREWNTKSKVPDMSPSFLRHGCTAESFFGPPIELIEMLLRHPDPTANANVAAMEDASGRLPLHAALEVASSPECISLLIKCHPTGLIHTAEETLFVPLHSAFCHEYTAPLQTAAIIKLMLQSIHAGRYGTLVDGRLAMKMEDAAGYYPIHYAAKNGACLDVITMLVERYPNTAFFTTPAGDLPVHCVVTEELVLSVAAGGCLETDNNSEQSAAVSNSLSAPLKNVYDERLKVARGKMNALLRPLLSDPSKLAIADHQYGMLPLHCAALFEAADYPLLLRMLELYPQGAIQFTTAQQNTKLSLGSYSPLDLHEMCKPKLFEAEVSNNQLEEWLRKRELLYSFSPTLESHRHRQELLERCVRVVIDELGDFSPILEEDDSKYRYHLKKMNMQEEEKLELEISHSVSNMEKAVLQSFGKQSRPPRKAILPPSPKSPSAVVLTSPKQSRASSSNKGCEGQRRSKDKQDIRQKNRKGRKAAVKTSSSMYDEENTSFEYDTFTEWYEADDGEESESVFSGVETDDPFSSDVDSQDETDTDGDDTEDVETEGDVLSGDPSRSFGYTTSGSRLRTTFEEGSGVSDDETRTDDDDDSRSYTDDTGTRRTYDDDDSTYLSRQPTLESDGRNAFDAIRDSLEAEEKKDDYSCGGDIKAIMNTPKACNNSRRQKLEKTPKVKVFQKPEYISEVAMRLWTFFVLYCDPSNPNDNYVKQVSDIFDEIKFSTVEKLVSLSLPPYAQQYVDTDDIDGLTFRDIASPKCRELIHKTCYFVGRYDLCLQEQQQQECCTSVLVHRTADGSSVTIRALEWLFTTEEATPGKDSGVAVENIWATGEIPAEIGVTFRCQKRAVWIRFVKDKFLYENELSIRKQIGISVEEDSLVSNESKESCCIVPLLSHYNALNTERKKDRTYKVDIHDERFISVNLFPCSVVSERLKIRLTEYPYALVYPASQSGGTLYDYFFQYGLQENNSSNNSASEEKVKILLELAMAVAKIHEKGLFHGNISMRNVILYGRDKLSLSQTQWSFMDLSVSGLLCETNTRYLGGVSSKGYPLFMTENLPPEMFVKLSSTELKAYNNHWKAVKKAFNVNIDEKILEPMVDLSTGSTYVVKCHFIPLSDSESVDENINSIPPLPYDLIPCDKNVDIWAFGQLVFHLWSGRTLYPVDARTGWLLDYASACNWCPEPTIYEHVLDPLAQDLLLMLLSVHSERKRVTMEYVLAHPFFTRNLASSRTVVKQMVEKRRVECAAFKREQRRKQLLFFTKEWLDGRTTNVTCWDFELLARIHLSPSEIVRGLVSRKKDFDLPCNFIILPYKLSPQTKLSESDHEEAELCGKALLQLSKACYFTSVMKQATSSQRESVPHKWSSSEMLRVLDLSFDEFGDVQSEMAELAAKHVEAFRHDPMSVALKLVQKKILNFFACFEDKPLFLYLVDEFFCLPICDGVFPLRIADDWRESVLQNGILSMHLCSLHARGVARNIDGLVKLIFNGAINSVAPTWTEVSRGLKHKLDEIAFVKEIDLLQDALTDMYSTKHRIVDDIIVVHNFLTEVDPDRKFAGVHRVMAGAASLWTTESGAKLIEDMSNSLTFRDAFRRSKSFDTKIKEYEERVDALEFENESLRRDSLLLQFSE